MSHEMLNPYYGLFQYSRDDIYTLQINPDSAVNPVGLVPCAVTQCFLTRNQTHLERVQHLGAKFLQLVLLDAEFVQLDDSFFFVLIKETSQVCSFFSVRCQFMFPLGEIRFVLIVTCKTPGLEAICSVCHVRKQNKTSA